MEKGSNLGAVEHGVTEGLLQAMPNFPRNAIRQIEDVCVLRTYERGDVIIREGQQSGGIFLLLAGTVQRSMSVPTLAGRRSISLLSVSAPALVGTASCLLGAPSTLTISAAAPTEAVFIPRAHLLRILHNSPDAGLAMSQLLSQELAHTYTHLAELRGSVSPNKPSPPLN